MELKNAVTVAELVTMLQTWAHEGHAEDIIGAQLYDGAYRIKGITKYEHAGLCFINLEPLSNERKTI